MMFLASDLELSDVKQDVMMFLASDLAVRRKERCDVFLASDLET
jgi:hypothetical protein